MKKTTYISRRPQTRHVLHVATRVKATLGMQLKSKTLGRLHVIINVSVVGDPKDMRTSQHFHE